MKLVRIPLALVAGALVLGACTTEPIKKLDAEKYEVTYKVTDPQPFRLVSTPIETRAGGKSVVADCALDNDKFSMSFKTPANLSLPDYGTHSTPIRVTCTSGDLSKTVERNALNAKAQNNSVVAGALFGVVGAMVASAATKDEAAEHYYTSINMKLD